MAALPAGVSLAERAGLRWLTLEEINELILDGVRRLRTSMSRRGRAGRKKKCRRLTPAYGPLTLEPGRGVAPK
jgi:hypothetical protein